MWNRRYVLLLVVLLADSVQPRRASAGGGSFQPRGQSGARGAVVSGRTNTGGNALKGGFSSSGSNGISNSGKSGQPGGFQQGGQQGGFHPQGGFQPNQGGFHPNQGGIHPNQGGFHPNQGGFHPQGGFNQGGFRPGSGPGSAASSGTFKKALLGGALGAVGGIVAYEAGKAIIQSATRPFNHGGNEYYWDNNHQPKSNELMCSMPLSQLQQLTPSTTTTTTTTPAPGSAGESTTAAAPAVSTTPSPDQILNNLQFADGTRPKTISWACKKGVEVCCGTDCCPAPVSNVAAGNPNAGGSAAQNMAGVAIGVLLLVLLSCCCCCFLAYKCCRSSFESFLPQSNKHDEVQADPYAQQYPMQQYPSQSYPQNQSYPPNQGYPQQGYPQQGYPQQGYPQQYPAHPTY